MYIYFVADHCIALEYLPGTHNISYNSTVVNGAVPTYTEAKETCADGYKLVGDEKMYCLDIGYWNEISICSSTLISLYFVFLFFKYFLRQIHLK